MEYMSREDYCEENCGKENREGYKTCTNCGMLNVPSADVQPVKCGKWEETHISLVKMLTYTLIGFACGVICTVIAYANSDRKFEEK